MANVYHSCELETVVDRQFIILNLEKLYNEEWLDQRTLKGLVNGSKFVLHIMASALS